MAATKWLRRCLQRSGWMDKQGGVHTMLDVDAHRLVLLDRPAETGPEVPPEPEVEVAF